MRETENFVHLKGLVQAFNEKGVVVEIPKEFASDDDYNQLRVIQALEEDYRNFFGEYPPEPDG